MQELHTNYLQQLIAYQQHIINLKWKSDYTLIQMKNTNGTTVSFGMLINAVTDTKLSKPVLVKMTGHEKLAIIVLLPAVTDESILM